MRNPHQLIKAFAMLLFTLCIFLSACKKKEIPGPKGEPGEPGASGAGGNANIISTNVFQVNASQWKVDTVLNSMKATIDSPQITKDVVEKGAVKVFIQTDPTWTELPFVRGDLFTQFGFDEGHLYLEFINIEGPITPAPQVSFYRMVLYSESQ